MQAPAERPTPCGADRFTLQCPPPKGGLANQAGRAEAGFGDVAVQAAFVPEHTRRFGFGLRRDPLWSNGIYRAVLDFDNDGAGWLQITMDCHGGRNLYIREPAGVTFASGGTYRLRATISDAGHPHLRLAMLRAELLNEAGEVVKAVAYPLNLSAENMPSHIAIGVYAFQQQPYRGEQKHFKLHVRDLTVRATPAP